MKKSLLLNGTILFVIFLFFSGCLEQPATETENQSNDIIFSSDLVDLIYSKIDYIKEENSIVSVEIRYLFRNIVDKDLNLIVYVNFYDNFDNLIAKSNSKEINLIKDYEETGVGPANIISYTGEFAYKVDHVEIVVEER